MVAVYTKVEQIIKLVTKSFDNRVLLAYHCIAACMCDHYSWFSSGR